MDRRRLWQFAKDYHLIILLFLFFCIMGMVMITYRMQFFEGLEHLSHTVRDMGISGYILMSSLIFLSAFPPMIGYSLFQTLSGFTFGFAKGFPISYFSALLGSIACFMISRMWLKGWVTRLMNRYPNLRVTVQVVEKKGFKLFLLIRLSPYPFNILNVLFAATNISILNFALGTAISLTKIALHIYIGANLTSFAKHLMGDDEDLSESDRRAETARIIAAAIGSILAFGVMMYIYFVTKRAIKEAEQGGVEGEESMAFLDHQDVGDADAASLEDWMEWNDDDDGDGGSVGHTLGAHHASRDLVRGDY